MPNFRLRGPAHGLDQQDPLEELRKVVGVGEEEDPLAELRQLVGVK